MRQYYNFLFTVLTVTGISLLSGCTPDFAGATTETTNGVTGKVTDDNATPAENAIVKLLPSDFNPMEMSGTCATLIDTTDQKGEYHFSGLTAGTYTVLARKRENVTSFLTRNVVVNDASVTEVPAGVLKRSGSITADFSQSEGAADGYVYIPGTDIAAPVANNGGMVLGDVPYGTVDTLLFVSAGSERYNILRSALVVDEDTTITIEQPLWRYGYRLVLNTSPSGADVSGDVFDFPLLVRLNDNTFVFSEADSGGEDLVFAGRNGKILPHEIERWDPVAQLAEVWVKIDTVYGNDATQSIKMYWGNPAAVPAVSRVVFDTADGFLGVWHFEDNGTDATPAKNNATVCTPADAEGMVGPGKKFNGDDSIKIATLFGKPQVVTLSAWARLDSIAPKGEGAEIVSIGDGCLLRMDDTEDDTFGVTGSYHFDEETAFHHVCSGRYLENTGWHHCVVVFNNENSEQDLYIDGTLSIHTTMSDSILYSGVGENTFIGIHGNGKTVYNFIGMIDEVRICRIVPTDDRVKLEYMNQKTDGALVVFEN
ncbi:MAG: DUF2341 domain-containing protein [Chitinispirillaceae bacterium]|nr:DUF2341 domain-containing protein [Chitinispirillaceae bacterium]